MNRFYSQDQLAEITYEVLDAFEDCCGIRYGKTGQIQNLIGNILRLSGEELSTDDLIAAVKWRWRDLKRSDNEAWFSPAIVFKNVEDFERYVMASRLKKYDASKAAEREAAKEATKRQRRITLEVKASTFLIAIGSGEVTATNEQVELLNFALGRERLFVKGGKQVNQHHFVELSEIPCDETVTREMSLMGTKRTVTFNPYSALLAQVVDGLWFLSELGIDADTWIAGRFSEGQLRGLTNHKAQYPALWVMS